MIGGKVREAITNVRILSLCSGFGSGTAKRLGILRRMAESIASGLFVAPSTIIRSEDERRPSHKLSSAVNKSMRENRKTYVMNSAFIIPVTS